MANESRRNFAWRSAPHRLDSGRQRTTALLPGVEDLEARRLLTIAINEFGGSANLVRPSGITSGPDQNLWFTEASPGSGAIGRITTSASIQLFTAGLSVGATPTGISPGPDDALWFTEPGVDQVGRIDTSGNITEFALPTPNSLPDQITSGPDGALWFTEQAGHPGGGGVGAIGRITTSGVVNEFFAGLTNGAAPASIASGPDGNLWFTASTSGGGEIGRITPQGVITEFPTPSNPSAGLTSNPVGITAGPNNDLYFTDPGNHAIGRITTAGLIQLFTAGLGAVDVPSGITLGPDGNVWFTDPSGNPDQVGQITPAGTITLIPTPTTPSSPLGIALGPDRNLWFTEATAHQIGQVVNTQSLSSPVATPATVTATVPSSFTLATFSDASTATNAANFVATIDYGDGSTGPGTVLPLATPGRYQVVGRNTYASIGSFTAQVTIGTATGNLAPIAVAVNATTPLTLTGQAVDGIAGRRSNTLVATLNDLDTTATPGDFAATVTWSDQSTSTANVFLMSSTSTSLTFGVYAGHSFATPGVFANSVAISESLGGLGATAGFSSAIVAAPASTPFNEIGPATLTPGASPDGIALGSDNALWFTENDTGNIGRVDTSGNVTEFAPIRGSSSGGSSRGERTTGIAAGPDGNLWFTNSGLDRIGQITTSGVFAEFSTGITPGATPDSITSGPDGALWFTEVAGNRIGRIATDGTIAEFSAGLLAGFDPDSITSGPDGNLWFVGIGSNLIGRITPLGLITEFPGATGRTLTSITKGPDGDLWFTEQASNQVGKINPSTFQVTEYTDPTLSSPTAITAGPDGNLWFTGGSSPTQVERITPNGAVTSFSTGLTPNSDPLGIATGPDGNLYFAEAVGDRIGQVILPGTSVNAVPTSPSSSQLIGQSFTTPLASFSDNSSVANLTNFQARVDWGDGTSSVGGINLNNGSFSVTGTHRYASAGTFQGSVTIDNEVNGAAPVPFVVQVSPALFVSGVSVFATQNNTFQGAVAVLDDIGQAGGNPVYTASIDWGDGTPATPGSVSRTAFGDRVIGDHVYGKLGSFQITVQVTKPSTMEVATGVSPALVEVAGPIDEVRLASTSMPTGITSGPDGNLWFTETGTNAIGRVTTGGVVNQFSQGLAAGAPPSAITSGPDGNLWFTQSGITGIGRITPQGAITEFTQGFDPGALPFGITGGPDGNVWFTDPLGAIGRITPQGVVTEFRYVAPQGQVPSPQAITLGPDGNLWFTDDTRPISYIGRVTPQGVITEFPATTINPGLTSIASGPDGALWFTEEAVGQVGRITTFGVVTEFSQGLPPGSQPNGITAGPDGNLWFVDTSTNHVDRITTSGAITSFAIPSSNSSPLSMVTGPDKNLWFTESTTGQIGQVVLPQSVTSTPITLNASPGVPLTATYATFNDLSTLVDLSRFFTPTIDFGDGTSGAASLVPDGSGGFAADATHTYQSGGTYRGSGTIVNAIGTSAPSSLSVVVSQTQPLSFVVTNTNDSGAGSLRQAILNADSLPGHTITFAIPGSGVFTIALASPLPQVTALTAIDGASQAIFEGSTIATPLVEVDGRRIGGTSPGLVFAVNSAGSLLRGLAIFGFGGPQVELGSAGDIVQGDYLGLRADGTIPTSSTPSPNFGTDGLLILAPDAIIGGLGAGQGNVISGNAGHGIELSGALATSASIVDNLVGLDPTGSSSRGNAIDGIAVLQGAGHETIGPGNVISGNRGDGVDLFGSGSDLLIGNSIGTDRGASRAIGDGFAGILLDLGSTDVTIGGTVGGSGNVISGNGSVGVDVQGGSTRTSIEGNAIGTDLTGRKAVGNGIAGVLVSDSPGNVVGPGDLVSGNGAVAQGAGIWIDGPASTGNLAFGDRIGTDITGEAGLGNSVIGVLIDDAAGNTIGGSFADGSINLISGNTLIGVMIAGAGASSNLVAGNLIGTNAEGSKAVGNGSSRDGSGVYIDNAPGNSIGGGSGGMGNVISGNGFDGVQVFGSLSRGNVVQGNQVGTDLSGTRALRNGDDGVVVNGSPGTRVVGNLIASNANDGIAISGPRASGTLIQANLIGLGIGGQELGNGAFGILVVNNAPMPLVAGNTIANNALGPIRDTTIAPASIKVSASKAHHGAAGKAKAPVKIQPRATSHQSRPMPRLQHRGGPRSPKG